MIRIPHESGRPVAVLGLGKSGLTAARALTASGAEVWAWDDDAAKRTALATTDLYACDWTFGTMYALHLTPNGSARSSCCSAPSRTPATSASPAPTANPPPPP